MRKALTYQARRTALRTVHRGARQDAEIRAMLTLQPLVRGYLPWTGASLGPAALAAVLNDVVIHSRRTIVECGGGISTVFIARLLEQLGEGRLVTLEHDPGWAAVLERNLADEGIGERVSIVVAPLVPSAHSWDDQPWYDESVLRGIDLGGPIDLLLVDGPPAGPSRPHARYPALPHFAPQLADSCSVYLDDILRRGEQDVLDRWESETDLSFERRLVAGAIAVAHRGEAFLV